MKSSIIIKPNQKLGLLCNSIACITSGLFYKENDICGEAIQIQNSTLLPITNIPILILDGSEVNLEEIIEKSNAKNLKVIILTQEAQFTTNYLEYAENVKNKALSELHMIGAGILGENKAIDSICGNLKLLR